MLVIASVLSMSHSTESLMREISHALGRILPEGTRSAVLKYFTGGKPVRLKILLTTMAITLWTGSGAMNRGWRASAAPTTCRRRGT